MDTGLEDYFTKCRCCLEGLEGKAVFNLTDFFIEKFFEVTQINLVCSENLSTKVCLQCSSEIPRMATARNVFINNQNILMEILSRNDVKVEREEFSYENCKSEAILPMPDVYVKQEMEINDNPIEFQTSNHSDNSDEDYKPDFIKCEEYNSKKSKSSVDLVKRISTGKPRAPRSKKGTKFICDICGKTCKNNPQLIQHKESVHEKIRNFKCDEEGCDHAVYRFYDLQLHKFNKHGGEHPSRKDGYFCDTCGAKFPGTTKLRRHIAKVHTQIKPFMCDLCPMRFFYKNELQRHIIKHIPKEFRDFSVPCDECGKIMFNKHVLKSHKELVHQKLRKFSCELCGKLYESKLRLEIHITSFHKKLKQFTCNLCNGAYITKLALKGHVKRQHPETLGLEKKTYTCEICGSTYKARPLLMLHMKKHDEPQFPCDQCNKRFFSRASLLDHQEAHMTLEFNCEFCPRSFRHESKLKLHHKKTHFKDKTTYRCEICNGTYTRRTTLRDHVLSQHPGLDEPYKTELLAKIAQMLPEEMSMST